MPGHWFCQFSIVSPNLVFRLALSCGNWLVSIQYAVKQIPERAGEELGSELIFMVRYGGASSNVHFYPNSWALVEMIEDG